MTYPLPRALRLCVGCGKDTDYDIYVKSLYAIPRPHCLVCSVEFEARAKEALLAKAEAVLREAKGNDKK